MAMAVAVIDNLWLGAERMLNVGIFHKWLICEAKGIEESVLESGLA